MNFFSKKNIRIVNVPRISSRIADFARTENGGWKPRNKIESDSGCLQKGCLGCLVIWAICGFFMGGYFTMCSGSRSSSSAQVSVVSPESAMGKIPKDKNDLIEAYNRGGLTYLDGNTREMLAICRALDSRRMDLALALLKSYPNLAKEVYQESRSGEKRTLLIWAAGRERVYDDFAKALVAAGADVNAVSSKGESALGNAVKSGKTELVQFLIDSGADVEFKTSYGSTLLSLACNNQAMQKLIYDAKKTFSEDDLKGVLATRNPDISQVKKILASGVKPTDELMYSAVRKNNAELLNAFLEAGGNADAEYNGTPVIFSCNYRGDISCAKLLVDYGANTNFTVAISGRTAYLDYLRNRRATELLDYIQKSKKSKSAAGTSASSAKETDAAAVPAVPEAAKTNSVPEPAKPELALIEKALKEIPADKNQLIEAYTRSGLTYLDGNTLEMLAVCRALDSRRMDLALALLKNYPNLAKEVYQERRSGEKRTLLIWASSKRSVYGDFAKALVVAGADVT